MTFKFLRGIQTLSLTGQRLRSLHGAAFLSRHLGTGGGGVGCLACAWTTSSRCMLRQGCRRFQLSSGRVSLSTVVRDPLIPSCGSVCLHRNATHRFLLTQLHRPTKAEERVFIDRLRECDSSAQVLRHMQSTEAMSDTMGASALNRLADLEQREGRLQDPGILESPVVRALCSELEQESTRLTDHGLVSALLACTRLYVDPWSTLMVRLVSETQERLDQGCLPVGLLCALGEALLALEGPDCAMLQQVMEQLSCRVPEDWGPTELASMYGLLQAGAGDCGRHQDLMNAMHTRTMAVAPRLDPTTLSQVLNALVVLDQTHALPLVISLCKHSVRHVARFSDGELALVLGALMHFGHSDQFFIEALERHVPGIVFTAHSETVTKVMQYLGRRNILSVPIFDVVAESFVYRADEYNTSQVARQIMPFGKLGYLPPNAGDLFRKVEAILHSRFSQFQPRTLLNLLHSCTLVERFPVNFVAKVFSSHFLQQLQEKGTGINRIVLAQLTQLYMTVKLECPFYEGPNLLRKYRVKSFLTPGRSLETPVDGHLYNCVKASLVDLLGARSYFASNVLTPYCYTLDVEIKLDEEGYVLPASYHDDVHKRVALCIDGQKRFSSKTRQLLGKEATKQRHLVLLGYKVVQIPFYEFEKLKSQADKVNYLHKKIFPLSFRLTW